MYAVKTFVLNCFGITIPLSRIYSLSVNIHPSILIFPFADPFSRKKSTPFGIRQNGKDFFSRRSKFWRRNSRGSFPFQSRFWCSLDKKGKSTKKAPFSDTFSISLMFLSALRRSFPRSIPSLYPPAPLLGHVTGSSFQIVTLPRHFCCITSFIHYSVTSFFFGPVQDRFHYSPLQGHLLYCHKVGGKTCLRSLRLFYLMAETRYCMSSHIF